MAKLRNNFRFQVQLHAPDSGLLRHAVRRAAADLKIPDDVAWIVDVDPIDMM
jgi:primosomal protein N'